MKFRSERDLTLDLARHLREAGYLTYTEIQLPSTRGQMDVVAFKSHQYANACIKGYEVKLSRAVFLGDVQALKYQKYMGTVNQLYFAAPQGLINKSELPPDTGLIVRTETGWHVQKAPRILKAEKLCRDDLLALLFRGYEGEKEGRRLSERIRLEENVELSKRAKNLGHQIASRLQRSKETRVEAWVEDFKEMINAVVGVVPEAWSDGGLPDIWRIKAVLLECCAYRKHATQASQILVALARTMNGTKDQMADAEALVGRSTP